MTSDKKLPLCWTCKYGLCVKQEGELEDVASAGNPESREIWEDSADSGPSTHTVKLYSAVCFWAPPGHKSPHPMEMMIVRECNRYEKI